jgi:hypothetical protein
VCYYNVVVKNPNGYTLDPPNRDSRMLTDMSEAEVLAVVSACPPAGALIKIRGLGFESCFFFSCGGGEEEEK